MKETDNRTSNEAAETSRLKMREGRKQRWWQRTIGKKQKREESGVAEWRQEERIE
jgi:hypothetical protein